MYTNKQYRDPRLDVPRSSQAASKQKDYKVAPPWHQKSEELVDAFEKDLNLLDTQVVAPWEGTEYDEYKIEEQKKSAAAYKFHSLFEVPPLPPAKVKQIENYKMNPPFNCGYNETPEQLKAAKKLIPDLKNPKTREPWSYGSLPAEHIHKKLYPQNSTTLWEVPRGDQSKQQVTLPSSGDPILDELRKQLLARGAYGIHGLARKFRIMDDNQNGMLEVHEFCKGMKESGIVGITETAMKHLFRYFGKCHSKTK